MTEYIERQAVLDLFWTQGRITTAAVKGIPAVDVVPVRHGWWVPYENEADKGFHYCSECKGQAFNYGDDDVEIIECLTNYCPNCGADMRKEARDG